MCVPLGRQVCDTVVQRRKELSAKVRRLNIERHQDAFAVETNLEEAGKQAKEATQGNCSDEGGLDGGGMHTSKLELHMVEVRAGSNHFENAGYLGKNGREK